MLKISETASIDLEKLIATRLLINANSGGGKSWAIRRLLEQSHGQVQQVVIDLEGEFSTLREKYDYLLVGQNGEVPVSIRTAELLARKLLELNVSTIIDLSELKHAERITFVKRFLDSLINAPKELWHPVLVIVDEAHQFCPEGARSESASAVIDLMTRGRKRGFCGVLATQRISKLNKDAAAEANNYLVGRTGLDIDMKRAGELLGLTSKDDIRALRDLKAGEFHAFGAAFKHSGIEKIAVGKVHTTHERAYGGKALKPVKTPENIKRILKDVVDLPKEVEVELRSLADHKKEIQTLKTKLTLAEKGVKTAETPMGVSQWREHGRKYGYADFFTEKAVKDALVANDRKWQMESKAKDTLISALQGKIAQVGKILGKEVAMPSAKNFYSLTRKEVGEITQKAPLVEVSVSKTTPPPISSSPENGLLRAGAMKMLNWLAGSESLTKQRIATLAGFKMTGGTFNTYLSELKRNGWIEQEGDTLRITPEGAANASAITIPSGRELLDMWMGKFRQGGAKILEYLFEQHPNIVTKDEIGAVTGFEPSGGTFNTYISELKRNNLIKQSGDGFVISDEFFQ